ncbi:MAG TPA: helix-turn-helix transcriptional regulator, partial [Verrucomicrobiae bacterium]|nr:helix-turn-helix transcriptional regulator [Verrucomicrobiae bacterium]
MQSEDHLLLQRLDLPASGEWEIAPAKWCFIRLDRGVVYCFQPGRVEELAPGEVLALAPGAGGAFRASQLGPAQLHYFYFQPAQLNCLLTLSERRGFELLASGSKSQISRFHGSHPAAPLFARLDELSPCPNRLLERCLALEIVALLFNESLMPAPPPDATAGSAPARFVELIQKLPEVEILHQPPVELARRCGCSLRHFTRLFRGHFGLSVRAKQIELRLETARRLLRETDASVVDIALDSGYHHLGLFNTVFKRRFGMTPTEFR